MPKKNPLIAAFLGFVLYPLGYFYLGYFWRGLAVFFLVPLIMSSFMPQSQFLLLNATANLSANFSNVSFSAFNMTNESVVNPFSGLNQSALFEEMISSYKNNPMLIFIDFFLRSIIALDCFFIARRINGGAAEKPKEREKTSDVSPKILPISEGMYYPLGVEVYCLKCKIGLAVVTKKCPNCGVELTRPSEKKK